MVIKAGIGVRFGSMSGGQVLLENGNKEEEKKASEQMTWLPKLSVEMSICVSCNFLSFPPHTGSLEYLLSPEKGTFDFYRILFF